MPLSDEEARLLQQLEQSLAADDPELASTLRGSKERAKNRRIASLGAFGFLVGLGVLFGGAVSATTWLGVIGFVLMVTGAYFFVTAYRRGLTSIGETGGARAPRQSSTSFVDRMEERWQRRQDGHDF